MIMHRTALVVVMLGGLAGSALAKGPSTRPEDRPAKPYRPGKLPLPIAETINKQNSDADGLIVQVTHSALQDGKHVAYVRVVWGDLSDAIRRCGREHYSNWDGKVDLDGSAGAIHRKIQFDDGQRRKTTAATPQRAERRQRNAEPREGSGRDKLITDQGGVIEWKAGVVGVLDGLEIKITSDSPTITGTVKAGDFTIPIRITAGN